MRLPPGLGSILERVFDAVVLAAVLVLAIRTSSSVERSVLLVIAALLLLGWYVRWMRSRAR
jgi:hypothetical protein